jgi:subtilisin family serine protease
MRFSLFAALLAASALTFPAQAQDAKPAAKIKVPATQMAAAERAPVPMIVMMRQTADPSLAATRAGLSRLQSEVDAVTDGVLERWRAREGALPRLQTYDNFPFVAASLTADQARALAADGDVAAIVENRVDELQLNESTALIGAPAAWARGQRGAGVSVAILDTGVDLRNPMFSTPNKVADEICFSGGNNTSGWTSNCPNGQPSQTGAGAGAPCIDVGTSNACKHGTHVAGIAVGSPANITINGTPATIQGVAPDARLVSVNVFSRRTSDNGVLSFSSDQLAAFDYLITNRATLNLAALNLSLGSTPTGSTPNPCDTDPRKTAIDTLRAAGVMTVIASGNDSNTSRVGVPGCISGAITVGSTTKQDAISSFSNATPNLDETGRPLLDVLAPGSSILSAGVPNSSGDPTFRSISGTSMATPHVAGAVAVLRAARPSLTATQMEDLLEGTGVPLTDTRVASRPLSTPRIDLDAATTSTFAASPNGTQLAVGAAGGTLNFSNVVYRLTNFSAAPVAVTATTTGSYLSLSSGGNSGTTLNLNVPANGSLDVVAAIAPTGLAVGSFTGSVQFAIAGGSTLTRPINLVLTPPLTLTTTGSAAFTGPQGGPFTSGGTTAFTITNGTPTAASATINTNAAWLGFSVPGGASGVTSGDVSVPGNGSTVVTFAPTTIANGLLASAATTINFSGANITAATRSAAITVANPPPNDAFANATTFSGTTLNGTNVGATKETGEPSHAGNPGGKSVWWNYTPTSSSSTTITTAGSPFDTTLAVYTGSAVGSLTEVASNDDTGSGLTSSVTFNAVSGTTYRVVVDGFDGASGAVTLNLSAGGGGQPPGNDSLATPSPLGASGVLTPVNLVGATRAAGEINHAGRNSNNGTVWYNWTPQQTAAYTLQLNGAGAGTENILGVYVGGTSESALTEVGAAFANNPQLQVTAMGGQVYRVGVQGPATGGATSINWALSNPQPPLGLFGSILPGSRAVAPNVPATVFANTSNTTGAAVNNCRVIAPRSFTGAFTYQTVNASNVPVGTVNTPTSIPAGAIQGWVLSATNATALTGGSLGFRFACDAMADAPVFVGANDWLFRVASPTPPDVIAIGATIGTPGIVTVPLGSSSAFAASGVNIGAAGQVVVVPSASVAGLSLSVCETTGQAGGACIAPPSATLTIPTFAQNQTRTFTVFVTSTGSAIPLDAGRFRVFLDFRQSASNGMFVGSTSAAVRTQ